MCDDDDDITDDDIDQYLAMREFADVLLAPHGKAVGLGEYVETMTFTWADGKLIHSMVKLANCGRTQHRYDTRN
jgi:hypothetical protein